MTATTHTSMHNEHRLWEKETGFWRDDIRAWQHELARSLSALKEIEEVLNKFEKTVQAHAAAIRLDELDIDGHEHALAEFEKGGSGESLIPLAGKHLEEAARHAQHRAAHERIKRRHHAIMALFSALLKGLADAPAGAE